MIYATINAKHMLFFPIPLLRFVTAIQRAIQLLHAACVILGLVASSAKSQGAPSEAGSMVANLQ